MKILKFLGILLLIFYIFYGSFVYYDLFQNFKSLPSPLYGGDYYYQMGAINHIREGGNPLTSSSIEGGLPGYMPVYSFLVANFCNFFGLGTIKGMLYFSIIIFIISSILWFILFYLLFENTILALIGVLLINMLNNSIVLKYTNFTIKIMIPLFFIFLYLTYKNRKNIIYFAGLGLIYGLLSLSHVVAFVGATLILFLFVLFIIFENKDKIKNINKYTPHILVFLLLSVPFIFMYWYNPIFKFHLKQAYDRIHMDTPDFARFDVQLWYVMEIIKKYLLNFSNVLNSIKTIFIWVGLIFLFLKRNSIPEKWILFLFISSALINFSYFLTEPLLHKNFIPTYLEQFYLSNSILIICLYGVKKIYDIIGEKLNDQISNGFLISLVIFLIIFSYLGFENYIQNDRWIKVAYNPLPPYLISLKHYLEKNGNIPNDVILTTKELGFSINAITGEKLVVNRWAQQNDPYIDLPQRDLDAAVILYGNDTSTKLKLLKKYNISYLYWDYYWPRSEWIFDDNGKIVSFFDPLMSYYSPEKEEYLKRNDVKYIIVESNIDPSQRGDKYRKYKLIIITPNNYYNLTHPWKPDLDKYLKPVWNYSVNGIIIAKLYKVELNE